jgi:hypothetical protein
MLRYYLGGTLLSRIATPFPTATFFIIEPVEQATA